MLILNSHAVIWLIFVYLINAGAFIGDTYKIIEQIVNYDFCFQYMQV